MAKARQLARSISFDKELNEMPLKSQLIYTWCIPFIDDFGLLTNDIGNIKYLIFPRNPHISEGDIRVFCEEATKNKLIESLEDCYFFKGFTKNNSLTEYKKAKSEFKENGYNKGKSKYSPEIPRNPQENPSKDKIREVKLSKDKNYMATNVAPTNMNPQELNDGNVIYEEEFPKKGKYGNKKKLYSRVVIYYMKLLGKKGNVVRFFPAMKEIYELHIKDFPTDTEEQIEKEIKGRIEVAHQHYTKLGFKEWGLGKVAENWDLILTWKV